MRFSYTVCTVCIDNVLEVSLRTRLYNTYMSVLEYVVNFHFFGRLEVIDGNLKDQNFQDIAHGKDRNCTRAKNSI